MGRLIASLLSRISKIGSEDPFNKSSPDPDDLLKPGVSPRAFVGREVCWNLTLVTMYSGVGGEDLSALAEYDWSPARVLLSIRLTDFPEILQCPAGSQITVIGRVKAVRGNSIYLDGCRPARYA